MEQGRGARVKVRARARAICGRETDGCGSGSGSGNSRDGWVIRILGSPGMLGWGCWDARMLESKTGRAECQPLYKVTGPVASVWGVSMYRCTYVCMCIVYSV